MESKRDPAIRITLLPRDTNSAGTIFGGVILSYIDMAGAIEAHRHTGMPRFVTVAMREVIFHKPVFVGDLVSFYAETVSVGKTSITIRVIVETERVGATTEVLRVTEAEVVYVAVDEKRQKTRIRSRDESSATDEELVESRLAGHHVDPNSSVPLSETRARLRSRSKS
ncbi:MAG: acyl-CoA thioesterase YciA [Pyrinomonadaceae bacterium]|jgi:acyl-CoA thioesterase YciA|nr:acyl-CoA thioesterase YciA [Pyrinomonadaceae bacterium]